MNTFKSLLMIMTFCFSASLFAEEKTIDQKLGSLKLEKMQAESMIATMAKRGHLNSDEEKRLKREIASVKEQDVEIIKTEALEKLNSKNSVANQ